MIKTEKKKKPFVLNREQHRHIKSLSKDALTEWLRQFYCEVYNEAISETYLAVMRHLHDDNDGTTSSWKNCFITATMILRRSTNIMLRQKKFVAAWLTRESRS